MSDKGFGKDQLADMQRIIDAENSDLFDALAHVAYALAPLTREERAAQAMALISTLLNSKQQVFLDFVLPHYVSVGVEELDLAKLTPLSGTITSYCEHLQRRMARKGGAFVCRNL